MASRAGVAESIREGCLRGGAWLLANAISGSGLHPGGPESGQARTPSVQQHNDVMPHSAFDGFTPDEVYFGKTNSVLPALAEQRVSARIERLLAAHKRLALLND